MGIKTCQVEKYIFINCCFRAAENLLETEDYKSLNLVHDGWMRVEDAAEECKLSPPTFTLRARQYLMPEKYGKLPEEFFDGRGLFDKPPIEEHIPIIYDETKKLKTSELPTLGD